LSAALSRRGHVEESNRWLRKNVAICRESGDRFGVADALNNLGMQLVYLGSYDEALQALEESLTNYRYVGFPAGLTHTNLGIARMHSGQYDRAQDHVQTGLLVSREMGYRGEAGVALFVQSFLAAAQGSYAEAQQLSQKSIAILQQTEQPHGLGQALSSLAYAVLRLGQLDRAQRHFHDALQMATEIQDVVSLVTALPGIALLLAERGKVELAVEIYALASRYPGIANSRWFEDMVGEHIASIAEALPSETVAAAQKRGRARELDTTAMQLQIELKKRQQPDTA
jgi:tetratricopeptide (TPR) repeat protein